MPVVIGSKFTGRPASFIDTSTGVYWQTLPAIKGDALKIQQALLAKPKVKRKSDPKHKKPAVGTPE